MQRSISVAFYMRRSHHISRRQKQSKHHIFVQSTKRDSSSAKLQTATSHRTKRESYTSASCSWTAELSPPLLGSPQVITEPSARIPAKARYVPWICFTFRRSSRTPELSPPRPAWPQVTTDPSAKVAANAWCVDWICWTFLSWAWTAEQSPPFSGSPQVTTDPSAKIAANASPVAWIYIYVVARDSALDLRLAQRQRAVTKH